MPLQDFLVLATTNDVALMLELRAARRSEISLPAQLHPQIARLIRSGNSSRQAVISACIRLGIASNSQLSVLQAANIQLT